MRKLPKYAPAAFYWRLEERKLTKADLYDVVFDLLGQSPWFDACTVQENIDAAVAKVLELKEATANAIELEAQVHE